MGQGGCAGVDKMGWRGRGIDRCVCGAGRWGDGYFTWRSIWRGAGCVAYRRCGVGIYPPGQDICACVQNADAGLGHDAGAYRAGLFCSRRGGADERQI